MRYRVFNSFIVGLSGLLAIYYSGVRSATPDGQLYIGLAENISSGIGYIDNIRNDEILPPIFHPLYLSFLDDFLSQKAIVFLSVFLSGALIGFLNRKLDFFSVVLSVVFIIFVLTFSGYIREGSIEPTLVFTTSALLTSYMCFSSKLNFAGALIFGLAILVSLLTRPVFLFVVPILFLAIFLKNGRRENFKILGFSLFFVSILMFVVSALSNHRYGDLRYISGTYSSIPLYCAFNDYIDLTKNYHSGIWKNAPAEATKPLIRQSTWSARDKLLKEKVIEFVANEPLKALDGYISRLSKFTVRSSNFGAFGYFYRLQVYFILLAIVGIALFSRFRSYKEIPLDIYTLVGLFTYYVSISSLFVYTGPRYLIIPSLIGLYLFYSVLITIRDRSTLTKWQNVS